eukprot:CAMPEP_0184859908 /NCGR_PEP_ID=MMETSP0580-20130426/4870_1 /TAXON_ID=1118495 /ORGANISM="Dactyliosolen fragilissimus" /LENGTH=309 /DNA_ID=CAMNT_0027356783 /DNA_START=92 /DNA_END=1021 /DNA_ORIENTATION=+
MTTQSNEFQTLLKNKDHLNAIRYIRAHKLREPEKVLHHGFLLLGNDLSKHSKNTTICSEYERLGVLEDICLAALDSQNHAVAERALGCIKSYAGKESVRYRRLLGLCLESSDDLEGALAVYNFLLKDNPSNVYALKRKYCILKASVGGSGGSSDDDLQRELEAREALNEYLERCGADSGAWAEMASSCVDMGDYAGAAYCYEEIVLSHPMNSEAHCTLAELYLTSGGKDELKLARKHMAQCLELDPTNLRATYGLISAAETYIEKCRDKENIGEDEIAIAEELIKYGVNKLSNHYKGTAMAEVVDIVLK